MRVAQLSELSGNRLPSKFNDLFGKKLILVPVNGNLLFFEDENDLNEFDKAFEGEWYNKLPLPIGKYVPSESLKRMRRELFSGKKVKISRKGIISPVMTGRSGSNGF